MAQVDRQKTAGDVPVEARIVVQVLTRDKQEIAINRCR